MLLPEWTGPPGVVGIVERGQNADLLNTFWNVSLDAKSTEHQQTPKGQPLEAPFRTPKITPSSQNAGKSARYVKFDVLKKAVRRSTFCPTYICYVYKTGGSRPPVYV